jgi:large subunit ribosomal protein L21
VADFPRRKRKDERLAELKFGYYILFENGSLTVGRAGPYNWSLSRGLGGSMYAVIKTGGKQYRVAPGDTIRIERVKGDVGEQVKFGTVLAVQTEDKKMLAGTDASEATVTGKIVEQGRAKKLTVLKYKKTNQYKIQRGHRQNYTAVQVSEIKL